MRQPHANRLYPRDQFDLCPVGPLLISLRTRHQSPLPLPRPHRGELARPDPPRLDRQTAAVVAPTSIDTSMSKRRPGSTDCSGHISACTAALPSALHEPKTPVSCGGRVRSAPRKLATEIRPGTGNPAPSSAATRPSPAAWLSAIQAVTPRRLAMMAGRQLEESRMVRRSAWRRGKPRMASPATKAPIRSAPRSSASSERRKPMRLWPSPSRWSSICTAAAL